MGIIEKLKRLHKQTLLKLNDIKSVVIAKDAGVDSEKYINRAKTLHDYTNPESDAQQDENQVVRQNDVVNGAPENIKEANGRSEEQTPKAATSTQSHSKTNIKL